MATNDLLSRGPKLTKTIKQKGVIAVDNGGRYIKVATKDFVLDKPIPSEKVFWFDRNVGDDKDKEYDFTIEWQGSKYLAGYVARRERRGLPLEAFTETKTTDFFILSVLQAIHMFGYELNFVATCIPIKFFKNKNERQTIMDKLIGNHTISINGVTKTFEISDVLVAPECLNAFWVDQPFGKSRWLDIGSRTVNYGTMSVEEIDGELEAFPVAAESDTWEYGLEKSQFANIVDFAKALEGHIGQRGWTRSDTINLLGGGALRQDLVDALSEIYPNLRVTDNPQSIQVEGMYLWAESRFEEILEQA